MLEKIRKWFKSKKNLQQQVDELKFSLERIKSSHESKIDDIVKKLEEHSEFIQIARDIKRKENMGISKKKKWLNGYPDQTKRNEV